MDIHEYQAKEILARFGVPVPRGGLAYSPEQAGYRARELGGNAWVVKAQVHSGGRGAAGGVKLCRTPDEVHAFAGTLFGRQLVTKQTDAKGKGVYRVWVEAASDIVQEMYLGFVLDRKSERIMIVASAHGGMEIEDLAETDPESLRRMTIDPAVGLSEFLARELSFKLGLKGGQIAQMVGVLRACYRAYRDLDAVMVEINPLVITGTGDLVALDAKMSFDTNAMFRQQAIAELRDRSQEDPRESTAGDHGLSYVGLEGDIGCIINGAGLAMATMDMIKLAGGDPANFLDIGGGGQPRTGGARVPHRAGRWQRVGDPGQHLCRHQPLRLGGGRRGAGLPRAWPVAAGGRAACRHECGGGARDHRKLGPAADFCRYAGRGGGSRRRRPPPTCRVRVPWPF